MHGLPIPGLSALLRAALFWVFWIVLCYALLRVSGPPPPDGLAIGEWFGAGREWFDRLLDGTPGAMPDNAALNAAFNAAPAAPESGALLAAASWLVLFWLGLSGLLRHAALLAPPLLGFGSVSIAVATASTFVRAPRSIAMLGAILLVLVVLQRGVAGSTEADGALAEATATPESVAGATAAASPADSPGATPAPGPPRLYRVREGDSLVVVAAAELGSARRFLEIRNADGSALASFAIKPGQYLLLPGSPLSSSASAPGVATAPPSAVPETPTAAATPSATLEPTPSATLDPTASATPAPAQGESEDERGALAAAFATAALQHDLEPPWPPSPSAPGFSLGTIADVGRAIVTARLFALGAVSLAVAMLAGMLVLALRRGRLPVRRVRRALRKHAPLPPQAPRNGSVIEAAGVLQAVVEALAGRQVEVRPLLVREYEHHGYELLLRCEPESAGRAAETVLDVSWRLGVAIEALIESPELLLLRCDGAPAWSGAPERWSGLVPCGAAKGDTAVYLNLVSAGSAAIVAPVLGRRALLREWLTSLRATAGPHYQIWSDDESAALLDFPAAGSGPCADLLTRLREGPALEQEGVLVLSPEKTSLLGAAGDLALDPRRRYELIVVSPELPPEWPGALLVYGDVMHGEIPQRRDDLFKDDEDLSASESADDLLLVMPSLPDRSVSLARLVVQRGDVSVPLPAPLPIEAEPLLLVDEATPDGQGVEPSALASPDSVSSTGVAPAPATPSPGIAPLADALPAGAPPAAGGPAAAGAATGEPFSPVAAPGRGHAEPAGGDDSLDTVPRNADAVQIAAARQLDPDPRDEFLMEAIEVLEAAIAAARRSQSSHLEDLEQRLARLQARVGEVSVSSGTPASETGEAATPAVPTQQLGLMQAGQDHAPREPSDPATAQAAATDDPEVATLAAEAPRAAATVQDETTPAEAAAPAAEALRAAATVQDEAAPAIAAVEAAEPATEAPRASSTVQDEATPAIAAVEAAEPAAEALRAAGTVQDETTAPIAAVEAAEPATEAPRAAATVQDETTPAEAAAPAAEAPRAASTVQDETTAPIAPVKPAEPATEAPRAAATVQDEATPAIAPVEETEPAAAAAPAVAERGGAAPRAGGPPSMPTHAPPRRIAARDAIPKGAARTAASSRAGVTGPSRGAGDAPGDVTNSLVDWPDPPERSCALHADLLGETRLSLRDTRGVYRTVQISGSAEVLRYLMATFRGGQHSWPRDEVEEAIWPNLAGAQRANLLREHCWDASTLIRRAGGLGDDVRPVELRRGEVRIIPQLFGSDLQQFRGFATAAGAAATTGDEATALRTWLQAAQLVSGVPLSACSSAWAEIVRSALQTEIVDVLDRGAAFAREQRRGAEAEALTAASRRARPPARRQLLKGGRA